jgi:hypothetical protein
MIIAVTAITQLVIGQLLDLRVPEGGVFADAKSASAALAFAHMSGCDELFIVKKAPFMALKAKRAK